jgi:DNA end-binding protein Ku
MKAIWSGSVAFGLVNIPVKLYSATQEEGGIKLRMLDKHDLCPIGYAKVCTHNHKEVAWKDVVKGYEYKKDKFVALTDEDFKNAHVRKTGAIDIVGFSDKSEIDPIYFEKPYFLEPDKKAARPYVLLREALEQSGKVAIAKFVIKEKEHIGAIKPEREMLILDQLRYASEIRSPDELNIPESQKVEKSELKIALELINKLKEKFDPKKYKDTYTQELKRIIAAKTKGRKITPKGEAPEPTGAGDIMAMLKRSLEKPKKEKVR